MSVARRQPSSARDQATRRRRAGVASNHIVFCNFAFVPQTALAAPAWCIGMVYWWRHRAPRLDQAYAARVTCDAIAPALRTSRCTSPRTRRQRCASRPRPRCPHRDRCRRCSHASSTTLFAAWQMPTVIALRPLHTGHAAAHAVQKNVRNGVRVRTRLWWDRFGGLDQADASAQLRSKTLPRRLHRDCGASVRSRMIDLVERWVGRL
jgi:hypothetical protein